MVLVKTIRCQSLVSLDNNHLYYTLFIVTEIKPRDPKYINDNGDPITYTGVIASAEYPNNQQYSLTKGIAELYQIPHPSYLTFTLFSDATKILGQDSAVVIVSNSDVSLFVEFTSLSHYRHPLV